MERKDELIAVFTQLQHAGRVATRKDFAKLLGVNYHGLIDAMNGGKALTASLVAKATALLNGSELPPPPEPEQADGRALGQIADALKAQADTIRIQAEHLKAQNENIKTLLDILKVREAQKKDVSA